MEVTCRLEETGAWPRPRVLAAGFFDGVHRGHQRLLIRTVQRAKAIEGTSCVLTFDPHPLAVVRPHRAPLMLGTMEEKLRHMAALGVEHVLTLPFDRSLQRLSPEEFVEEVIVRHLSPEVMIVGFNFTFGSGATGRVDRLEELLDHRDIVTQVIRPVVEGKTVISSTAIRDCLADGHVERATSLLGRAYRLVGKVDSGYGRGRKLGFPTCNLTPPANVMVPKRGVYAVSVQMMSGEHVHAVCNIGHRPTFGDSCTAIEVHLMDYAGNHYGETLEVDFHLYLRDEQRFASAELLKEQIAQDIGRAREYFSRFACTSRV